MSIFRHKESYGVISLHELKGNGVSHVFEFAWISVRRCTGGKSSSKGTSTPGARGICIVLQGAAAMVTIVHPVRELSCATLALPGCLSHESTQLRVPNELSNCKKYLSMVHRMSTG